MSDVTREEFDELKHQVQDNTTRLHNGDLTMTKLDMRLQTIEDKLDELSAGVKQLQEKPAKRWDAITGQIINWVIALLLGVLAIKVGLGA